MFETNFDDFLSVRGHQSRSTSFPSIHFGGDEDEESDEDSEEEEDEEDESTEEEASRSKKRSLAALALSSKKGSGIGGGLSGALSPSGTETSSGSTMAWGSRVLYIQMEYVENQTLKEVSTRFLSLAQGKSRVELTASPLSSRSSGHRSRTLGGGIMETLPANPRSSSTHDGARDRSSRSQAFEPTHRFVFVSSFVAPFPLPSLTFYPSISSDHENRIKIGDFGLAATDFAPSNETLMIENTPLKQLADAADLTSGSFPLLDAFIPLDEAWS